MSHLIVFFASEIEGGGNRFWDGVMIGGEPFQVGCCSLKEPVACDFYSLTNGEAAVDVWCKRAEACRACFEDN